MPLDNPRKAVVKVFVYPGGSPPFVLESDYMRNGELTFKNGGGHFGCVVEFVLQDCETTGYYFPDDPAQALAAAEIVNGQNVCPQQGTSWDQFKPVSVSNNNTTLTVENENGRKRRFGYTLFVTQDPHKRNPKCLALDPIGNNQNGDKWPILGMTLMGAAIVGAGIYSCTKLGD